MKSTVKKDKVSLKDILSPLQVFDEPASMPAHSQIKSKIIDKQQELAGLEKRQREIDQKIHEQPFLFFRNLVYEVEFEKINDKKIKLVKEIESLSKRIPNHSREAMNLYPITAPISRGKHGIKYVPLSVINEHRKVREDLSEIQNKLEKLYEQKSVIYQEIINSPTGIANEHQRYMLNELDMIESSLSSREEDLEKDIWNGSLLTRRSVPERINDFTLIMSELSSQREHQGKSRSKRINIDSNNPNSSLSKEELEQLDELDEIRNREFDKEKEDEFER